MLGSVGRVGKFLGTLELALERFLAGVTPDQTNLSYRTEDLRFMSACTINSSEMGGPG